MGYINRIVPVILAVGLLAAAAQAKGFFKVGDPAPNFTLETVDGQTISLAQYKGKVVVLGLFHICEPCMIQGTELQKVHQAFRSEEHTSELQSRVDLVCRLLLEKKKKKKILRQEYSVKCTTCE